MPAPRQQPNLSGSRWRSARPLMLGKRDGLEREAPQDIPRSAATGLAFRRSRRPRLGARTFWGDLPAARKSSCDERMGNQQAAALLLLREPVRMLAEVRHCPVRLADDLWQQGLRRIPGGVASSFCDAGAPRSRLRERRLRRSRGRGRIAAVVSRASRNCPVADMKPAR